VQCKLHSKEIKITEAEELLLTSQLGSTDATGNTKHFLETITFMERENEELKQLIQQLEAPTSDPSDQKLVNLIGESDELLTQLQKEYEAEKKRNDVLEKMHSDWKNLDKIRSERD
jgi:plasmid maintenance system antidote protein VapI